MLEMKLLEEKFQEVSERLLTRGFVLSEEVLILEASRKAILSEIQQKQTEINSLSKTFLPQNVEKVKTLKTQIQPLETKLDLVVEKLKNFQNEIPNIPQLTVPIGRDQTQNREEHQFNGHISSNKLNHWEIVKNIDLTAASMSSTRFSVLHNQYARLERALKNFMLDHNSEWGYIETSVPYLVNEASVYGVGQLPKFRQDLYETQDSLYLISTGEVPLTNLLRNKKITEPLRFTTDTPCFRREAGSAGRDTKGMLRQHQFHKVELVTVCDPSQSDKEHIYMRKCAESLLEKLNLTYRTMLLCTGDMGFSSTKTWDLEVWLPGQNAFREISSISNCESFQSRRINIKTVNKTYAHTLNGSSLAIGRTMIAIIENYYNGTHIEVPKVLIPYMNGVTHIDC